MVKTTKTKETMRLTNATKTSPTLRVIPPIETVKDPTPLPAEAAGASIGVRMSSERDLKNSPTTPPR